MRALFPLAGIILLSLVHQVMAVSITPNPLIDFPGYATGQINLSASTDSGLSQMSTAISYPSPSCGCLLPINISEGPISSSGFGYASATASVSSLFLPSSANGLSGDVTLTASGQAAVGVPNPYGAGYGTANVSANAAVVYYMEIVRDGAPTSVSTTVTATGIASYAYSPPLGGSNANATVGFGFGVPTSQAIATDPYYLTATASAVSGLTDSGAAYLNYNQTENLLTDTPYQIVLYTSVQPGALTGGECDTEEGILGCSVGAFASIDPTFTLNVSDPQDYTIDFSPNLSTTPLPSTWTMLIASFVGLGFLACRGAKKNSAAIAAA